MAEVVNLEKMYHELLALRKEVQSLRNRMIEIELVMTADDENLLNEVLEEHRIGKTRNYEDLKKELGD
jgi:hypothetical protein